MDIIIKEDICADVNLAMYFPMVESVCICMNSCLASLIVFLDKT